MAHDYDVSLKTMLRESGGEGVFAQMLVGGPIAEWLNVEQPQVSNRFGDLLARVGPDPVTGETSLCHVELQSRNNAEIAERMLDYYVGFWRVFRAHIRQVVLYLGGERLTMPDTFRTPSTTHRYEILTMAELDGEALLASDHWIDNELALLTRADRERVYEVVLAALRRLDPARRAYAGTLFTLISGIIGVEEETKRRLDSDMLDIMENKVLGPMIQQEIDKAEAKGLERGMERGLERGLERGVEQGRRRVLAELLARRFGPLSSTTVARIDRADEATLTRWTDRLFDEPQLTLEAILS